MATKDASKTDASSEDILVHTSLNSTASTTIVLIHGAFAASKDWGGVAPYLKDYHLLIPDLPSHGRNLHVKPFSPAYAAQLIAKLIAAEVPNKKAHIVGHSLGSHVALALATTYPDFVQSMLISGFHLSTPHPSHAWLRPYAHNIWYVEQRFENLIPRSTIRWLMDGTDLPRADPKVLTPSTCREILDAMYTSKWPEPWPARSLIIVATKSGIVPSLDDPEQAKRLMGIGRELNSETIAVRHRGMRHPWNLQDPELFARTVRAWVEEKELPEGFERL